MVSFDLDWEVLVMAKEPSMKSHLYEDSSDTDYFCRQCKSMKFRCEGCVRVVCRCEKNNGHMMSGHYYICLGKGTGIEVNICELGDVTRARRGGAVPLHADRFTIDATDLNFDAEPFLHAATIVLAYINRSVCQGAISTLGWLLTVMTELQQDRLMDIRDRAWAIPRREFGLARISSVGPILDIGGHYLRDAFEWEQIGYATYVYGRTDRTKLLVSEATELIRDLARNPV
jgi:hypothetical protein